MKPLKSKQPVTDERINYYWQRVHKYGKKYPEFNWFSTEALLNLIYTYDIFVSHFAQRFAKHGLSISAFNVLMILSRSEGKSYKQQDLSKLLLVSRANMTGVMDSLVRQGLVVRMEDENDRRACIAKMTKAGERLLEKMLPSHYEEIANVLSGLKNKEKQELSQLLTKCRESFQVSAK